MGFRPYLNIATGFDVQCAIVHAPSGKNPLREDKTRDGRRGGERVWGVIVIQGVCVCVCVRACVRVSVCVCV